MWKNIILDWSGTVVDDLTHVWESTNHVLNHYGRPALEREAFRSKFLLPWMRFYEEHLPGVTRPEIEKVFWVKMQEAQSQIVLLPGAAEFLEFCRASRLPVFVLSTVDPPSFWGQSDRLGVSPFLSKAYVGVEDKREVIEDLVRENHLDPEETVMVGDMVHDVEAARRAGVASCAVLSGFDPPEKLAGSRPDLVLRDIGELRSVLAAQQQALKALPVPTVGALIFDSQGRVLMLRTAKWSSKWGIPGGKIRRGETMEAALRREILEETGLELEAIRFEMIQDCIEPGEFFRSAHFLLINYTARAKPGAVRLNDEAQDWKWVAPEEALRLELNAPTRALIEHVKADGRLHHH